MTDLAHLRCLNHANREAVARCLECTRYFCRECITEHDDRVICATCLKAVAKPRTSRQRALAGTWRSIQWIAGVLLAWYFFFLLGQILLRLPDSFHNTTLWGVPWLQQR
jgi:hypothetical protein